MIALAATLFAVPAQAIAVKPDLVVTQANLAGKPYLLTDGGGTLASRDVTRNDVPKDVQSRAGASKTRLELVAPDGGIIPGPVRDVPALGPGDSDDGGAATQYRRSGGHPIGAYRVRVCADVTDVVQESNESNNCKTSTDRFFIVRTTWTGTLGGDGELPIYHILEKARSYNAKFVFDAPISAANGVFRYDFAGSVFYKTNGSSNGCTYLGSGTRAFGPGEFISPGYITFDYLGERYSGTAAVDSLFYRVNIDCGGPYGGSAPGPMTMRNFFYAPPRPFPFGATKIAGAVTTKAGAWSWDLH